MSTVNSSPTLCTSQNVGCAIHGYRNKTELRSVRRQRQNWPEICPKTEAQMSWALFKDRDTTKWHSVRWEPQRRGALFEDRVGPCTKTGTTEWHSVLRQRHNSVMLCPKRHNWVALSPKPGTQLRIDLFEDSDTTEWRSVRRERHNLVSAGPGMERPLNCYSS